MQFNFYYSPNFLRSKPGSVVRLPSVYSKEVTKREILSRDCQHSSVAGLGPANLEYRIIYLIGIHISLLFTDIQLLCSMTPKCQKFTPIYTVLSLDVWFAISNIQIFRPKLYSSQIPSQAVLGGYGASTLIFQM